MASSAIMPWLPLCPCGGRRRACAPGQSRPGPQLCPEDLWLCLPEPVDALFQIAHQEQVVPLRGCQTAVKRILQRIGILVFIHHHRRITAADVLAQRGRMPLGVLQQVQRLVLKIAEFQHLALPLFCSEPGVKVPHRIKQSAQPGQRLLPVRFCLRLAAADQLLDLGKQLGRFIGPDLDLSLMISGQAFFIFFRPGGSSMPRT